MPIVLMPQRASDRGLRARRCQTATGTAIVVNFADRQIFIGDEYRIDVSSEAGSTFDQNVTGRRAEEEIGLRRTTPGGGGSHG